MDIVKHIKDFGDGAFDALITAPIAIGDFIARGTGIRDWQLGTGNYYMEQARIESEVLWQAIKNNETRNLVLKELGNEIQEKPFYFLAGFSLGIGVGFGSSSLLKAAGVGGAKLIDAERLAYSVPLSLGIYTAKVHEKVHKLAKENPEMYDLLKNSGILDAITDDNLNQCLLNNSFNDKNYNLLNNSLTSFITASNLYNGDTLNISLYDPIALDLNANGKIDTLSLENGAFFDHNGDDIAFKSSWISGEDGILARDINGDGAITSGAELFGNFTKLKNGELAKNGAQALKDLDDNNDGIFDSNDKAFNEILVWQDKNSDGISQKNELKTLNEHNIKSIDLEFMADNTALDKDNKQILIGSFSTNISNESKNNLASDIDFSVDTIQRNILDDTDGIIKGTGFVRNFNLSLSDEIKNAYESYKALNTKQQQLSNVETLVNLWAKTAKQYKELDNPIQKAKINISSVASGTTSSGIDEAIKRAEAREITLSDGVKISA